MRSVQIEASAHHSLQLSPPVTSVPCLALPGTVGTSACLIPDLTLPASCLPSLDPVYGARTSRRSSRLRYYEGSDSWQGHPAPQVSPLIPPCLPDIPSSTTPAARQSLCQSSQRRRLLPGFTTHEKARHSFTPKQVRYPTDCQFVSGCSPPRLASRLANAVTFDYGVTTPSRTDLHRADIAASRTHSCRAKARHPRLSSL
jgi:hypothetical protein